MQYVYGMSPHERVYSKCVCVCVCVSDRNVASCCPLRGRGGAATRWTATSCARAAARAASRTSRPKSPQTANGERRILHIIDGRRQDVTREVLLFFIFLLLFVALTATKNDAIVPSVGIRL